MKLKSTNGGAALIMAAVLTSFAAGVIAQTPAVKQQAPEPEKKIQINPASKARIKFDNEEWDFGAIPKDSQVAHNFKIINTGDDTLIITKVRPTCGCTIAPLSNDSIPPKGEAYIYATFNTKNINGRVTKWIYVDSTDPINPYLRISFSATINDPVQLIQLEPLEVDFGKVEMGKTKVLAAQITNNDSAAMEIVIVDEPSRPSVTAKLSKTLIKPQESSIMSINLESQYVGGEFIKSISLEAKGRPETRIKFR